jgi:hypothetical protein
MKLTVGLLILLCGMGVSSSAQQSTPAASEAPEVVAVDTPLHENAVKLVELMGSRKRILDSLGKSFGDGKAKLLESDVRLTPEFADEWVKRMVARTNVDDYVNVIITAFEKHYNASEIAALIEAQRDANDSKTPTLSPELKEKVQRESNALASEVVGGCSQLGAKLGADIAQEIEHEHPEWVKQTKPSGGPEPKK